MWGLSPSDNNASINAYKAAQGITNPCAGNEGGGPDAIDIVTDGQNFLGYPTFCVICPDKSMSFDVCWPNPAASCFDPYIEDCIANSMMANFTSDVTEVCEMDQVYFSDMSTGNIISWDWTFEGGDPAISTDQNPVVTYNDEGTYDVGLTVSDGTNSATLLLEDYINVLMTPPTMLLPFDDVCVDWPAFELTGGSPAGGEYSGTGVTNGFFDPTTAGLGTHTITYTYTGMNGCDNFDEETIYVDPCTGVEELAQGQMRIYPNPTTGDFELKLNHNGDVNVKVINMLGVTVYEDIVSASGKFTQTISLNGFENGIYFIAIQTGDKTSVKKLRLIN